MQFKIRPQWVVQEEREREKTRRGRDGREKRGGNGRSASGGNNKGGSMKGGSDGSTEATVKVDWQWHKLSLSLSPLAWCVSMRRVEID